MSDDYDHDNDIFYKHWGNKRTKESVVLFDGDLILDIDDSDEVVGMEILNFMKHMTAYDKKMEEIFKRKDGEQADNVSND